MTDRLTSFTRDGLVFDVVDSGPADGEAVVLLHGFPQRASCWDAVREQLDARGYRTLAPDQRGYSRGARPRGRRPYALTELTADVVALLDAAGLETVHLVGHDWGAAVAWSVAAAHPERLSALTAVSIPHTSAYLRAVATSSQSWRSTYMAFFQLPVLPERVLAGATAEGLARAGMTREMAERFHREIVDDGALTGGLAWYRAVPATLGRQIPPCRVPTTHIWSRGDVAIAGAGPRNCGRWVEAPYRYVEIDGSHWIPDERPEVVVQAVTDPPR